MEAIQVAESGGIEFLIIDSLSHAWAGEGGMLDQQNVLAKRTGNSYTSWREITPLHNRLVDKILQSDMHVMLALRTKTEYVIEDNDKGRKAPRKIGTAPVFREGLDFEVTTFFDVGQDHMTSASKDRTGLFDGQCFLITPDTGAALFRWQADAPKLPKPENTPILSLMEESLRSSISIHGTEFGNAHLRISRTLRTRDFAANTC